MSWWWFVVALAGCGRFHFDGSSVDDAPIGDGASDAAGDATAVDPDLLVWLPFDDNASTGVENRGVLASTITCPTTCPGMATGKHGGAYDFTTDVLQIADDAALHLTTGTIAMWIYPRSLPGQSVFAIFAGTAFGTLGRNTWEFFHHGDPTSGLPRIQGGGDAANALYADIMWTRGASDWFHVALTWDGANARIYVNGTEIVSQAQFALTYDGHPVTIGADQEPAAYVGHFDGLMDDVRIYRRTLDAAELAVLAQ